MTKTKEVASWQAAMEQQAKNISEKETVGTGSLSFKGGRIRHGDNDIGDQLECVVIAASVEKTYYDKPYDKDNIEPPRCFSQSIYEDAMVPHENVKDPIHETCKGCPKAEFGTARQGKGPACKTHRRLVVLPTIPEMTPAYIGEGEVAMAKIPPTSVKHWQRYSKAVADGGMPPWAVKTTIHSALHDKFQFEVTFKLAGPVGDGELLAAIHARTEPAEQMLLKPFEYEEEVKYG